MLHWPRKTIPLMYAPEIWSFSWRVLNFLVSLPLCSIDVGRLELDHDGILLSTDAKYFLTGSAEQWFQRQIQPLAHPEKKHVLTLP